MAFFTLPVAHSRPRSGPRVAGDGEVLQVGAGDGPHDAHRLASRTPAPDPDGHAVAQLRDDVVFGHPLVGHACSGVLGGVGVALVDEGVAQLVGHARQVELEGEALLEPVGALHVPQVDAVEALLGGAHHRGRLLRDVGGHLERGGAQLVARHDPEDGAEGVQLGRGRGGAGVDHRPHLVLRHQARQVRGRAQRAAVDLGEAEEGVVAGDHDVGVADEADAATDAEAVHRGDQRHRAVVDRGERGEAALVGADQGGEALGVLHLLDVDAGVEALALAAQDDDAGLGILARPRSPRRPARTSRRRSARSRAGTSTTISAMPCSSRSVG